MNWIDKAIEAVAPERAMRRVRARVALAAMQQLIDNKRSYDGARIGRGTTNWIAGNTSANFEIESAFWRLRNRSRDLVRNNGYARRAIASLTANAVGTGVTASSDKGPENLWKQWQKECDYYSELDLSGVQSLTARSAFESGECLIVRVRLKSSEVGKSGVPLKIKVLEADYLDIRKHGPLGNGNIGISGVEVDKFGRRVAYWIHTQHPGDAPIFQPTLYSVPVPAEDVIHHFEKERPGQLRGAPRLGSSIIKLHDLDEWHEAELVRKKIESCFAAFVETNDDNRTLSDKTAAEDADPTDGVQRRIETMSPGMIEYMKPGEKVTFGAPNNGGGDTFSADMLREIAMGCGLTYEQLTGDLSRVNFSSMRAGRQEFKQFIEQYRWLSFIPGVCERIWGWFIEAAYAAGKVRTNDYPVVWTPPKWDYVNPLDDVKTDKEELDAGLSSWSEQIRRRGMDPEVVMAEIKKERDKMKALGVTLNYSIVRPVLADTPGAGESTTPAEATGTPPPAKPAAKGNGKAAP